MNKSIRLKALWFILLIFFMSGCAKNAKYTGIEYANYASYREIPGVTTEEIEAIEKIRAQRDSFVYTMLYSTETFLDEENNLGGYTTLLCDWLSGLFGIPFRTELAEWDDLIDGLAAGTIDFTGELTASDERRKTYFMTDAIVERPIKMMRISGSEPLSVLRKSRPLTYAFLEDTVHPELVLPHLPDSFQTLFFGDYDTVYRALKSGTIDAFFDDGPAEAAFDSYGDVTAEDFFPLIYSPVSLTTQNPQLEPFISVVQKILKVEGTMYYLTRMYNQGYHDYLRHRLTIQLTPEEREYIRLRGAQGGVVKIAAEYDNYPASFFNSHDREWQGIALEVLSEIGNIAGLSFEIVNNANTEWAELLRMLEEGQVSLVTEMIRSTERAERFLWTEEPYQHDFYALLSAVEYENININEVLYSRIGLIEGAAYTDVFHQWFPEHTNTVEYANNIDAFNALSRGKVDLVMATRNQLLSITNYLELSGYKTNIIFNYPSDSYFGLNINETTLCSIISKAQKLINVSEICDKWERQVFDYRSKMVSAQRPWLIGSILLLFVIIVLIYALYRRNRNVGKRLEVLVRQRTAELDISRQELSDALVEAEMANQAKSAFLATMSHEIRTPLNAIIGITQIQLQKENLSDEYAAALEKIYASGNNLLGIINDILDMSKIETGKMELNPAEYDLSSLINDAVQLNIVRIGSKPIDFILDLDENLPSRLYGDELRLKQILNNLLSNAIKYTDKGQVKLLVDYFPHEDDIILRFTIMDTGQGMKSEDREKLFSEYLRFNVKANRDTEGTGLGLNITKKLVDMMGGAIKVESEYGKGSVFTVMIRQKIVEYNVIGAEVAQRLRNFTFTGDRQTAELQVTREPMPYGSVLVVDDLETNLYVAEGMLLPYKLNIETADSGFAAIEKIKNGKTYDIIFMDHMMPKMDGIETTEKLREMGYKGVIVALTANAMTGNDAMFARRDFNGFIPKPIDTRQLNVLLNKFIRDKYPEEAKKFRQQAIVEIPPDETRVKLLQVFRRDAEKAAATLRETVANGGIKLLTTTAHAMKSALANVGETEKSRQAAALEQAGLNGDINFITANTEKFVKTLESLIKKLTPAPTAAENADIAEDTAYLKEHLQIIKTACEQYDDTAAYAALDNLKKKTWKPQTAAALENIRDALFLHSDFDGVAEQVEEMLSFNS